MNTAKIYHDSDGNECTINQMVHREPIWAALRIQEGEDAIKRVKELESILKRCESILKKYGQRGLISKVN